MLASSIYYFRRLFSQIVAHLLWYSACFFPLLREWQNMLINIISHKFPEPPVAVVIVWRRENIVPCGLRPWIQIAERFSLRRHSKQEQVMWLGNQNLGKGLEIPKKWKSRKVNYSNQGTNQVIHIHSSRDTEQPALHNRGLNLVCTIDTCILYLARDFTVSGDRLFRRR